MKTLDRKPNKPSHTKSPPPPRKIEEFPPSKTEEIMNLSGEINSAAFRLLALGRYEGRRDALGLIDALQDYLPADATMLDAKKFLEGVVRGWLKENES